MTTSAFGQVSDLEPAIAAEFRLDFSSGNLPPTVTGPDPSIIGPRTYCDQDRMYVALPGQARIGFDHDRLRWGLRRDAASENMVVFSNPLLTVAPPRAWNGSANGLATTTFDAADFLLPSERCAMMDYSPAGSTYIYPHGNPRAMAYVSGRRYTGSVFIKSLGDQAIDIPLVLTSEAFGSNQSVQFVGATGQVVGGALNASETIVGMETYPNGWKRIYVTATCTTTVASYPPILWPGGNRAGKFLFGGFQLEALGFPTSYIPTKGAAVVRGDERGISASFPADFFNSPVAGQGYSLWADYTAQCLFLTAAVGVAGTDRVPASAPYVSLALTGEGANPAMIIRTYYTATPTHSGTTRTNGRIFPSSPRNVHCATWRNDPLDFRECNLAARADAVPVTTFPTFAGFTSGLSSNRFLLGSMMNPDSYILTGWIYEARMYRRLSTDDQLKEATGV
jgi:hypothetical protein